MSYFGVLIRGMKDKWQERKLTTIKGSWQGMKIRSPILVILINCDENCSLLPLTQPLTMKVSQVDKSI